MKYILLSLISGVLLSLSWPTYGVPFFIFIALIPLLMAEHQLRLFSEVRYKIGAIFGLSYLTFFIWNLITTGWLYQSQNPDGTPALMAVLFPVLANSLLYTLVFVSYSSFKKYKGTYWGLVLLVVLWLSFEKFHLEWELTWPWLNLGNAFSEYPLLIQWYDTLGATGGSLWVLLANVFGFYTYRIWQTTRKLSSLMKNTSLWLGLILLPMLISYIQYHQFEEKPIAEVGVLMLQPNIDPYTEKYQKDSLQMTHELLHLSKTPTHADISLFLAPETALPGRGSFSETGLHQSYILSEVKKFMGQYPQSVFTLGISSHRVFSSDKAPKNAHSFGEIAIENYNSALQISAKGISPVYHKGKLVPGVEIFPYLTILKPILGDAMLNFGGTIASLGMDTERKVFSNPYNSMKIAPIICYESVYGDFVGEYVRKGANLLTIMTNDSWWGVSEGHRQLLSYARLRAIETRREVVRAANSGISAHIDALGNIHESTLYGDRTSLYAKAKLYEGTTFYTRTGDLVSRLAIFTLGFILFYTLIQYFKSKKK